MAGPFVTRIIEAWRTLWAGASERSFWLGEISSSDPALAQYFGSRPAASGVPVSEWTALNYSAYWAGVQSISGSDRLAPAVSRIGGSRTAARSAYTTLAPLSAPARRVQSRDDARWWRARRCRRIASRGATPTPRSSAIRTTSRSRSGRLPPDLVLPDRAPNGAIVYRVRAGSGAGGASCPPRTCCTSPGSAGTGSCGYSVIRKAREAIGLGLATEQFGALFFGEWRVARHRSRNIPAS